MWLKVRQDNIYEMILLFYLAIWIKIWMQKMGNYFDIFNNQNAFLMDKGSQSQKKMMNWHDLVP